MNKYLTDICFQLSTVFAEVAKLRSWIDKKIEQNGGGAICDSPTTRPPSPPTTPPTTPPTGQNYVDIQIPAADDTLYYPLGVESDTAMNWYGLSHLSRPKNMLISLFFF